MIQSTSVVPNPNTVRDPVSAWWPHSEVKWHWTVSYWVGQQLLPTIFIRMGELCVSSVDAVCWYFHSVLCCRNNNKSPVLQNRLYWVASKARHTMWQQFAKRRNPTFQLTRYLSWVLLSSQRGYLTHHSCLVSTSRLCESLGSLSQTFILVTSCNMF